MERINNRAGWVQMKYGDESRDMPYRTQGSPPSVETQGLGQLPPVNSVEPIAVPPPDLTPAPPVSYNISEARVVTEEEVLSLQPDTGRRPAPAPSLPVLPIPDGEWAYMAPAIAYVKKQRWSEVYEPEAGLSRGTIFPELDLPFSGEGACPYHE